MTKKQKHDMRDDAIKAVIFVFVLLAVAEVAAPFFHLKFEDPLLLAGFVTGILGHIVRPRVGKPHLLVVKESDLAEVVDKLGGSSGVSIASSPDHAVELVKQIDPGSDAGVVVKLGKLLTKSKSNK